MARVVAAVVLRPVERVGIIIHGTTGLPAVRRYGPADPCRSCRRCTHVRGSTRPTLCGPCRPRPSTLLTLLSVQPLTASAFNRSTNHADVARVRRSRWTGLAFPSPRITASLRGKPHAVGSFVPATRLDVVSTVSTRQASDGCIGGGGIESCPLPPVPWRALQLSSQLWARTSSGGCKMRVSTARMSDPPMTTIARGFCV
jgi:hypothetical protein